LLVKYCYINSMEQIALINIGQAYDKNVFAQSDDEKTEAKVE